MNLDEFNFLSEVKAKEELKRCCGSSKWVENLLRYRPFLSIEDLYNRADQVWAKLTVEDWLEAFQCHPRIGDLESLRKKYGNTQPWALEEQKGALGVSDEILHELTVGNELYEKRFGHIFLVCATGKSAIEMLTLLKTRINNSPKEELQIAAQEQAKITKIRLKKILDWEVGK